MSELHIGGRAGAVASAGQQIGRKIADYKKNGPGGVG